MNAETLPLQITEVDRTQEAPSPFLPGTNIQYAWDSTALSYLKTCPRLYQYIMIDGWASREESLHLTFGNHYHAALEYYDRCKARGTSHGAALREAVAFTIDLTRGWKVDLESKVGRYKNRESLIGLVVDYLDKFADDRATTMLLEDGRPAVELSFRFELDWGPGRSEQPYLLCGHLDKVVEFAGAPFVLDRKTTTTTLGSYYFDRYEPDNQMTLYSLAARVILNAPIKGVIIDAAQIKLQEPNHFERGITYRTPDQLDEWVADLHHWLSLAEGFAIAGHWPMNDTACDKFGGCRFREVCRKSPHMREKFLVEGKFTKLPLEERWNPMKVRG